MTSGRLGTTDPTSAPIPAPKPPKPATTSTTSPKHSEEEAEPQPWVVRPTRENTAPAIPPTRKPRLACRPTCFAGTLISATSTRAMCSASPAPFSIVNSDSSAARNCPSTGGAFLTVTIIPAPNPSWRTRDQSDAAGAPPCATASIPGGSRAAASRTASRVAA